MPSLHSVLFYYTSIDVWFEHLCSRDLAITSPRGVLQPDRVWFSDGLVLNGVSISSIFVLNRVSLHCYSYAFIFIHHYSYALIYRTLTKSRFFYQFANVQHIEMGNSLWVVHSSRKEGYSLPVGVWVFLRQENPEFTILAAIVENTRRGGAGVFALARSYPAPGTARLKNPRWRPISERTGFSAIKTPSNRLQAG